MGKKSILHETGERVKKLFTGHKEERESRREARNTRHDIGAHRDGFKDISDAEWLFGVIFLVLIIVALSPGVLLTIPPGRGGFLMSGNTSTIAAFVHAVLLVVLLNFL